MRAATVLSTLVIAVAAIIMGYYAVSAIGEAFDGIGHRLDCTMSAKGADSKGRSCEPEAKKLVR